MARYRFEQIAFNSTEKKKPEEHDRFTYLGLEHLDSGCLKVSRFGAEVAPVGDKLVMRKGDVLFGKRRAYQKKVAIAPFDGIFSAHGMVLRPRENVIDAQFFPFFISSDYFLDAAIKISVGSLSPTINWRDLKNLEFDLPSLEEQRKLASVLQSITETIESYKAHLSKTDELVKSQFIEQFGDPVENSKNLPSDKLGNVTEVGSSKRVFVSELTSEGIPFYRGTEIGYLAESKQITPELFITKEHYSQLKEASGVPTVGDLLMPSICPDGRIWQVLDNSPFYFKDCSVLWIHLVSSTLDSTYLLHFLKRLFESSYEKIASGTTFAELKICTLKELRVIIPDLTSQHQFARLSKQLDKSKFTLQHLLQII